MPPADPPDAKCLSRREFLKLAGAGLLALTCPPLIKATARPIFPEFTTAEDAPTSLGRVLNNNVTLYKTPSFDSEIVRKYWFDHILPITSITLGDDYPAYNRVWYEINHEGFVHSGALQPVEVRINEVARAVPFSGQLAEITVPYTDALWTVKQASRTAYRLYYNSVHWVQGVEQGEDGKWYYKVLDDRNKNRYYANATHLRLMDASELAPLSPEIPARDKKLEVWLKQQVVVAYEAGQPVFYSRAATGARFSDGDFRTSTGLYITSRKRPTRHMAAGEPGIGTGYDLPGVPWVCYLTKSGVAFHGTYWHNDFGNPRSHGCINLSPSAAKWVYRWTLPTVPPHITLLEEDEGTEVRIYDQ